jgi:hypothetical protein
MFRNKKEEKFPSIYLFVSSLFHTLSYSLLLLLSWKWNLTFCRRKLMILWNEGCAVNQKAWIVCIFCEVLNSSITRLKCIARITKFTSSSLVLQKLIIRTNTLLILTSMTTHNFPYRTIKFALQFKMTSPNCHSNNRPANSITRLLPSFLITSNLAVANNLLVQ